ncbi:MAG TPA: hypothetical protein VGJ14_04395 [Sporichthyaceae bacterium]
MPARSLGKGPRRLFGGYGPLLALAIAFLLVVTFVPTIARQVTVVSQGAANATPVAGAGPEGNAPAAVAPGQAQVPGGKPVPGAKGQVPGAAAAAGAGPCANRRIQVVGDPYSPPCIAWPAGKDNGGATSTGITKDSIKISFRLPVENISDFSSVIRQLAGDKANKIPAATDADVRRTIQDYATYFSQNFQMYGRKLDLQEWHGKGSVFNEFVGAGQDAAQADAIHTAKELKAFADISAFTQPYNDALARQGVVAIGAPYMSRQWFAAHQPYSWSPFPDCTTLSEIVAEYLNKRVFGYPADHAGPGLAGQPRKLGIITPDNPEYQQCLNTAMKDINAAGNKAQRYSYTLDLARFSDQANNIAAKLKQDGITTVVLLCDPLFPLLVTNRMSQQQYYPEYVVTGTVLTDSDEFGQLYDEGQWKHAFGLSQLGQEQPQGASFAYAAAKSVDPDHEPIFGADLFYQFFYQLALGIQMAGPNLTAQTFAAGMRAYPGGTGPSGSWGYPDGAYSPYRDGREIWWDPSATSVVNGAPGRYESTNKRYKPGAWPHGPAAPQQKTAPAEVTTPARQSEQRL